MGVGDVGALHGSEWSERGVNYAGETLMLDDCDCIVALLSLKFRECATRCGAAPRPMRCWITGGWVWAMWLLHIVVSGKTELQLKERAAEIVQQALRQHLATCFAGLQVRVWRLWVGWVGGTEVRGAAEWWKV